MIPRAISYNLESEATLFSSLPQSQYVHFKHDDFV